MSDPKRKKIAEALADKPGPPQGLFGLVKPMSDQERTLREQIANGGQNLGLNFRDPTSGIMNADPFEMATGMPLTDGNEDYDALTRTALAGVAGMATPAYLQPGYEGPQTGMGPVGDFAAGLGQVFQGGSGAGSMGAPALAVSQFASDIPDAGRALGTMGGGKVPKALSEAEEIAKIRKRMQIFEDMPPIKEMSPERAAQLRAEAEADRLANPPQKYDIPPMEDFLPKKPKGKK